MTPNQIAVICHEANKALCEELGDRSQLPWRDAPDWQRESAINGVEFCLANPDAPTSATHESWLKEKLNGGWVYGETKDAEAKTHPCIVAFNELPLEQQAKDCLFNAIVRALAPLTA